MSEVETNEIEQEVTAPEVENQPIHDFINSIQDKNFTNAETLFKDMLDDRVQSALDQTRIGIADTIFNNVSDEEETEEDLELSDEEISAELETEEDLELESEEDSEEEY